MRYIVNWVVLGLAFLPSLTWGQSEQNLRKQAYTSLTEVDDDFAFQGEFRGVVRRVAGETDQQTSVGLQVIALGGGQFAAVQYAGGLPGSGWTGGEQARFTGQLDGDLVRFTSDGGGLEVSRDQTKVLAADGSLLGILNRTHRASATLGASPAPRSLVLFNGTNTRHFKNGQMTEDGLLKEGTEIVPTYRDFTLHLEFRLPYMPYARGQGRANSGVYLQSRYEVQILDSFGLEGVNNECGALYRYQPPDVNMCLPPLTWQTYDIDFRSPRFNADGDKVENARITVRHNGYPVHQDFVVERKTGAGQKEERKLLPIKLQNHSNPVRFRNIWILDHEQPPEVHPFVRCCPTTVCTPQRRRLRFFRRP